jgi:cytochrome bd-type quinol oxidase subunit 2
VGPIILAYTAYCYWLFRGNRYDLLLMAKQSKHPWLWFVGLWLAGVLTVTAVSYAIRFLMFGFN